MPTDPEDELTALRARVAQLESELKREQQLARYNQRLLSAKEREVQDIYLSRAWGMLSKIRGLKYRYLDPLLGIFGINWPKRRASSRPIAQPAEAGRRFEPSHPTKHDVICLSIIDWDDRFQRPQHLMGRFAAAGHRVFYVGQHFRRDGPLWEITERAPNVYDVTLRGAELNVYQHTLNDAARDLLFDALDALRRDVSLNATAVFVQLPFWWPLARKARERFGWPVIYDCMDHHAGFSSVRRQGLVDEEALLSEADLVVVSSAALEERARAKNDRVLMLRNACDFDHFAAAPARANNERPVIGFYGAIADWFDSALVADLARRRPDWDFLLVGSTWGADLSRFSDLQNLSLPGEQPYETIPMWLARFDVAIIPFLRTSLTVATNPVKVYEMLAGGKPIVSVPIPEVAALSPMVRLASTAAEFEREIEAALAENGDEAIAARRAFAKQHTWDIRFEVLGRATMEVFPRTSVVVFPPSIGWHVDLMQRPHHLARAFARNGFRVIFDVTGARDSVDGFLEIEPGLYLSGGQSLADIPDPLVWTFPYNYQPGKRVVYDWIDDLSVFPYDQRELQRTHERALREATIVTCVARTLHEQALAERPDALYLPNAVEYEHFAEWDRGIAEDPQLQELIAQGKPIAGYYGALASWFDFDLLDAVAQQRTDWNFLLIGAVIDASQLQHALFSRANVSWIGSRSYPILPGFLQAFDVAVIPFTVDRITDATSPLKLYEYLAGGKPVVSTPMPECAAFDDVIIAATAAEFSDALDAARTRGTDPAFRDRVRAIAKANSWDVRVQEVLRSFARSSAG